MDLRMRTRVLEAATLVEVGGEIDLHSAPQLRATLLKITESAAPRVVVDLAEVIFIDSTGIGVLVGALKRARENSGALHFCGAQQRVRRVFEITGLLRALPLFDTQGAALEAFGAGENGSPTPPTSVTHAPEIGATP